MSNRTGVETYFLGLVDVLDLEGFDEVYYLYLKVECCGQKTKGLGIQFFVFSFLTKWSNTSWDEEGDLGIGGIERVLYLSRSGSAIETFS